MDLLISLLTHAVGATHAEIAMLLELKGYVEFDDYVAGFRIREFCNLINNGDNITIEDTFFRVGSGIVTLLSGNLYELCSNLRRSISEKGANGF